MVALATAFVALSPQLNRAAFVKSGQQAGLAAGQGASAGFFKSMKGTFAGAANLLVPLALAGAVKKIYDIGTAYQDNLNIFQAVTKATGVQMDKVAQKARDLGADFTLPGVSAAGAADAMTELAKAGFTVQQSMDAAKGTLQLARIANISEADAATVAANAVNAFGIAAKDTTFVVDELAAAANQSSVDINDVDFAFRMASATFSGFQGPTVGAKEAITELNTSIAILGNNGIRGSDAGTSLKQMLLQLTGPTERAKTVMQELALRAAGANVSLKQQRDIIQGSKKVRDTALKDIIDSNKGIKAQGDIAYTAAGKMRSLPDVLNLVIKGTRGMTDEQKNAAITQIFGADATRSVIALMKGGLPVYERMRKAVLLQGAAADFAKAKNIGLKGSLDNVRSQVENIAIEIFNQVKGPLTRAFVSFATSLAPLPGKIKQLGVFLRDNREVIGQIAETLKIAAAAWFLYRSSIIATTVAMRVFGAVQGAVAFVQLAAGVRSVASAMALLDAAFAANPIGITVVAVAALAAGLIYAYKHSEKFRSVVDAVGRALKTAFTATINYITGTLVPNFVKAFDQVKSATLALYHNVILPVWHAILAVIEGAITGVKAAIHGIVVAYGAVKSATSATYNFLRPVFSAIGKLFEVLRLIALTVGYAIAKLFKLIVIPAFNVFKGVVQVVFNFVKGQITSWWNAVRAIFTLFQRNILGPVLNAARAFQHGMQQVFRFVGQIVVQVYNTYLKPKFDAIGRLFNILIDIVKIRVVGAFRTGVDAIKKIWSGIQEAAKRPVKFVVQSVINPFIVGLNKAASIVGVPKKYAVAPIKLGFAEGGQVPGYASGGRIAGAASPTDNRLAPASIPGVGAVKLAGGEFIVNAKDTMKALPLLRWVNDGMKGGAAKAARYLGKPLAQYPGDGSEGWAFKGGGLVGWVGDIWNALSHPLDTIKKPFNALVDKIPGGGMLKSFLGGAAKKLLDGAVNWISGGAFGSGVPLTGRLGAAASFLRAQNGKPYIWASAGPNGYDCSGIVSAVYNILKGKNPYSHTFSTESLPGPYFRQGSRTGPLLAGWSHPGQSPASASVGHMAGQLMGLPFESSGSRGVHLGSSARSISSFANIGSARFSKGGLFGSKIRLFDEGGYWPSGTLGANLSGRTEFVKPNGTTASGDVHIHLHNDGVIGSQDQLDRWLTKSVKRLKAERKI